MNNSEYYDNYLFYIVKTRYRYFVYGRLLLRYLEHKYRHKKLAKKKFDSLMSLVRQENLSFIKSNLRKIFATVEINATGKVLQEVFEF